MKSGEYTVGLRVFFCATLLSVAVPFAALAAKADTVMKAMVGTLRVASEPFMMNGRLAGCQLVFDALIEDWKYRNGDLLKIEGSVGVMIVNGTMGTTLKVGVREMQVSDTLDVSFLPSPPTRAYLIGDDLTTSLDSFVSSSASDTPGALFSIFDLSPTVPILIDSLGKKVLRVAFNQLNGDSDIILDVETDVTETDARGNRIRADTEIQALSNCLLKLGKENAP